MEKREEKKRKKATELIKSITEVAKKFNAMMSPRIRSSSTFSIPLIKMSHSVPHFRNVFPVSSGIFSFQSLVLFIIDKKRIYLSNEILSVNRQGKEQCLCEINGMAE